MSSKAASRRSSSAARAATAKRPAVGTAESAGIGVKETQANKRAALGDVTNVAVGRAATGWRDGGSTKVAWAPNGTAASKLNSATSAALVSRRSFSNASSVKGPACGVKLVTTKPAPTVSHHDSATQKHNFPPLKVPTILHVLNVVPATAPCSSILSPTYSRGSVSINGKMSNSYLMKRPDFENIDGDSSMLTSLERQANERLLISEDRDGTKWKKNAPAPMEINSVCAANSNNENPQMCHTLASDIYMLMCEAESKKRPSADFMEKIQKDVTPSMRAILIDWLVEVTEEYRLVLDTLYLTVNYIDRYLSVNKISRQRLQLLGVACMFIAAKHEEICAPHVEEFCYITDNTYFRDEVLEMEASVLNCLKFQTSAPTAKCFLRRFLRAAQTCDEDPAYIEVLANYVAELSLLEYNLVCYPPSLIAASAIFLAKFILYPTKHPWNPTLANYTRYKAPELGKCVKVLCHLFSDDPSNNLPAIREKYGQHKYKFVAKMRCPASIPPGFLQDATC